MSSRKPDKGAHELVEPHTDALRILFNESLEETNRALNTMTVKPYKRLKATLFHNIVAEKAKEYFNSVKDVRIVDKYESPIFGFGEEYMARFKKLNPAKLLSSNYPTPRNNSIIGVQGTLFPEYPKRQLIEIGYIVDSLWDQFEMLVVVARKDNKVQIIYEIARVESPDSKVIAAEEIHPEVREEKQLKIKRS
ncbi:MAG: hypothetical protein JST18_08475 [Bacteroidetes bacterium]|nr:hypothetical protein [Bacteroidota bacterium]